MAKYSYNHRTRTIDTETRCVAMVDDNSMTSHIIAELNTLATENEALQQDNNRLRSDLQILGKQLVEANERIIDLEGSNPYTSTENEALTRRVAELEEALRAIRDFNHIRWLHVQKVTPRDWHPDNKIAMHLTNVRYVASVVLGDYENVTAPVEYEAKCETCDQYTNDYDEYDGIVICHNCSQSWTSAAPTDDTEPCSVCGSMQGHRVDCSKAVQPLDSEPLAPLNVKIAAPYDVCQYLYTWGLEKPRVIAQNLGIDESDVWLSIEYLKEEGFVSNDLEVRHYQVTPRGITWLELNRAKYEAETTESEPDA